jgi:hypothetical protein
MTKPWSSIIQGPRYARMASIIFITKSTQEPNDMKLGKIDAVGPGISRLLGATTPLLYV